MCAVLSHSAVSSPAPAQRWQSRPCCGKRRVERDRPVPPKAGGGCARLVTIKKNLSIRLKG